LPTKQPPRLTPATTKTNARTIFFICLPLSRSVRGKVNHPRAHGPSAEKPQWGRFTQFWTDVTSKWYLGPPRNSTRSPSAQVTLENGIRMTAPSGVLDATGAVPACWQLSHPPFANHASASTAYDSSWLSHNHYATRRMRSDLPFPGADTRRNSLSFQHGPTQPTGKCKRDGRCFGRCPGEVRCRSGRWSFGRRSLVGTGGTIPDAREFGLPGGSSI
jgi:hypothetical protein